jgi:hypothetical protein
MMRSFRWEFVVHPILAYMGTRRGDWDFKYNVKAIRDYAKDLIKERRA